MEEKRPVKREARLFIALVGPMITAEASEDLVAKDWTTDVFPVLCDIAKSGRYALFLYDNRKDRAERSDALVDNVISMFSRQGIVMEYASLNKDGDTLDRLKETTDTDHSWIIATEPEEIALSFGIKAYRFVDWRQVEVLLSDTGTPPVRRVHSERNTKETKIALDVDLDGHGDGSISTGLPFFDHMLEQIARHAKLDITLDCEGDLEVDEHHTVEDVAIVLGQAVAKALGDKRGIGRYGFELLPMDECLAEVALDFSGRSWFVWDVEFSRDMVGSFPLEMFPHFFKSFSDEAKCNLHMRVNSGNAHHQAEALFKAFARALRSAIFRYPGNHDLPSTKGVL